MKIVQDTVGLCNMVERTQFLVDEFRGTFSECSLMEYGNNRVSGNVGFRPDLPVAWNRTGVCRCSCQASLSVSGLPEDQGETSSQAQTKLRIVFKVVPPAASVIN